MKRRTLLTTIITGMGTFAGCMGSDNSDGWSYQAACDRMIINYWNLPDNVKNEVDTAFAEGEYETKGNLYYELLIEDKDEQYLFKDDKYYMADIDITKDKSNLEFNEVTPTFDPPKSIRIRNTTDNSLNFTFTVDYEAGGRLTDVDGERIRDRGVSLGPEEVYETVGIADEFGAYEVTIEFEDGRRETDRFVINRGTGSIRISLSEDQVSVSSYGDADDGRCPWTEN
ncbi:hypothetical protein [Natrinema sp. HArc-T2]|uniref:hypothetical protein n=1 Tax=Natrinema sp. HArc-T2 TaxID=3242701 RepID=UPI00359E0DBA